MQTSSFASKARIGARVVWAGGIAAALALSWLGAREMGWLPSRPAALHEEPATVLFEPGGAGGKRMRLDWLDAHRIAHTDYLRSNGLPGLTVKDSEAPALRPDDGRLQLALTWPSLHVPAAKACPGSAGVLLQDCPIVPIALTSARTWKEEQRLKPGEVWQWTAFRTQGRWGSRDWAGWECNPGHLQQMNKRIDAPNAVANQSAVPLAAMQPHCGEAPAGLARHWHWAAGWQEHPVLWSCAPAVKGNAEPERFNCEASFVHGARLVTLQLPGRAWEGQGAAGLPMLHQLRPKLVEAAWRTLEDGVAAAGEAPPTQAPDALRQELAWCEELAARSASLRRTGRDTQTHIAWGEEGWQIGTPFVQGPCSRTFHRVLRQLQQAPAGTRPGAALVQGIRRLGDIERAEAGRVSAPVAALAAELIARELGANSVAMLEWRVRQRPSGQGLAEVLAQYDGLRNAVAQLPAPARLALRWDLQSLASGQEALEWEFLHDWLPQRAAFPLAPALVQPVLMRAATSAHWMPPADAQARLRILLPAMQATLRELQSAPGLPAQDRQLLLASLALHVAWHGHWMVLHAPDAAAWRTSLDEHTAWTETALAAWQPAWITGVRQHRDAAHAGRLLQPDCPGGAALGCSWDSAPATDEHRLRMKQAWLMLTAEGGLARGSDWIEAQPRDLPNQSRGETLDTFYYRCAGKPGSAAARDVHWVHCVQGTRICADPGQYAQRVYEPLDALVGQVCRRG